MKKLVKFLPEFRTTNYLKRFCHIWIHSDTQTWRNLKIWQSGGPCWYYHKLTDFFHVKSAFLFQWIQVLDVEETVDRQQGKEYDHDLSETEKAIVREMCNVSLMCFIVYSVLKASSQLSYSFKNIYFKIDDHMSLHFFHENKTIALVFYFQFVLLQRYSHSHAKTHQNQRDWWYS